MEEKNVTKISLSMFFLILAIIAIIVMGIFIYKLNNDKTAEIQKSTELQAQVNNLNGNVKDLQSKIDSINNTINSNTSSSTPNQKETSNVDNQKSVFTKGIYKHENTKVTFDDTKFNIYLDENFSLNGIYEIIDNKTIMCNISEYTFNDPDGIKRHDVDKNEKWSISFNIKDEKSLEVKNINLPDREVEIIITIFNLIETGNRFSLQS